MTFTWGHFHRKQSRYQSLRCVSKIDNQNYYPKLVHEFQGFRVCGTFISQTDTPTNLANQVIVRHALHQSRNVQSRGPERAHQNNVQSWQSLRTDQRLSREFWHKWLYFHSKCGIKTKTHFEWLLWHWSSLGQLNLEPTQPKWPHGLQSANWPCEDQCKKSHAHGFLICNHISKVPMS